MEKLLGILGVIFMFSVAIFVHELGHFLFAKLFRVEVKTFSIGFGRKIWKRHWRGTDYAVGWIPFGGYVQLTGMHSREMEEILGEDGDGKDKAVEAPPDGDPPGPPPGEHHTLSESVADDLNALRAKPYWQKVLIFSAGCINNFLTAVFIFFLMAWIGHHRAAPAPAIIDTVQHVERYNIDLRPGDRVLTVEGRPVSEFDQMLQTFVRVAAGQPQVTMGILRNGDAPTTVVLPSLLDPGLNPKDGRIVRVGDTPVRRPSAIVTEGVRLLGRQDRVEVELEEADGTTSTRTAAPVEVLGAMWLVFAADPYAPPYVAMPSPNLPAEKAGIRMHDTVIAVDGKPVRTVGQATDTIRAAVGRTIPIVVKRGSEEAGFREIEFQVEVRPDPENPERGQIGVFWGAPPTDLHRLAFVPALTEAFQKASRMVVRYLQAVRNLLFESSFQTVRESVGGPVAIAQQSYTAAARGGVWFFELFALFNIILAVTNLLPLPVLDGGHILFATIESVIRRPLPARWMLRIYNVFIFLLIGLALLVTFNDFLMNAWRLIH